MLAAGLLLGLLAAPLAAVAQNLVGLTILSPYRSLLGADNRPRRLPHAGVDFGGLVGAPVLATADGVVSRIIEWPLGCGLGVLLEHRAFRRWTAYCHLQGLTVRPGQHVSRGEQIGQLGTSGNAFNTPHVHLELCTSACTSHADGDLSGTEDPLKIAAGCFDDTSAYSADRLVLTFPVACLHGASER